MPKIADIRYFINFTNIINKINKERVYALMLIFILIFNIANFSAKHKLRDQPARAAAALDLQKELREKFQNRQAAQAFFLKHQDIAIFINLIMMLVTLVFALGVWLLAQFSISSVKKKDFLVRLKPQTTTLWGIIDAAKVIVLFIFFGYLVVISQSVILKLFNARIDETLGAAINTAVMDVAVIFIIIYFVVKKFRQRLIAIGLSFKNTIRDISLGIAGYVAFVPLFALSVLIVAGIVYIFKFAPPPQPIVELFVKEQKSAILAALTIFVALVGPIAEELFFRAFMYPALRKRIGALWGIILTALIFSGLHTSLAGLLPIFALGLMLTYLYEKTGSIIPSITAHMLHNILTVSALFGFKYLSKAMG